MEKQEEHKKITPERAHNIIKEDKECIILDVRTQEEFDEKHIEGAVLVPHTEIVFRAFKELADKNARILVYCRNGRRSRDATLDLTFMGYPNVFDFGGIETWPYEVVKI